MRSHSSQRWGDGGAGGAIAHRGGRLARFLLAKGAGSGGGVEAGGEERGGEVPSHRLWGERAGGEGDASPGEGRAGRVVLGTSPTDCKRVRDIAHRPSECSGGGRVGKERRERVVYRDMGGHLAGSVGEGGGV